MLNSDLLRRGLYLEYATLTWNVIGTIVIVAAAIKTRSVALAGFGLDSLIEIFASLTVVWQLNGTHKHRERTALRCIAGAFIALAIYVLLQSVYSLAIGARPVPSISGIVWLVLTVAAMLFLAYGKHVTGGRLENPVLITEARVTLIDAYLAAALQFASLVELSFSFPITSDTPMSIFDRLFGIKKAAPAAQPSVPAEGLQSKLLECGCSVSFFARLMATPYGFEKRCAIVVGRCPKCGAGYWTFLDKRQPLPIEEVCAQSMIGKLADDAAVDALIQRMIGRAAEGHIYPRQIDILRFECK